MDSFEFKKHLFRIANGLSTSDVKGMKFLLQAGRGYIQRRQAERIKSGFELLCVLAEKNYVAPAETGLLAYLLEDVHKSHLLQPLLAELGAPSRPARTRAPHGVVAEPSYSEGLENHFQALLKNLGERLSEREFRNLALFYADKEFSLEDIEQLRQPSDLFLKLSASHMITITDLQKLLVVFDLIGRADLCKLVNDYIVTTKDYINTNRNPYPQLPPQQQQQQSSRGREDTMTPIEEDRRQASELTRLSSLSSGPASGLSDTVTLGTSDFTSQSATPTPSNLASQGATPPPSNPATQGATPSRVIECTEKPDPALVVRVGNAYGITDAGDLIAQPEDDGNAYALSSGARTIFVPLGRVTNPDKDATAKGNAHCPPEAAQGLEDRGSSQYDTMDTGACSNIHCQPESAQGLEGGGGSQFDTMSAGACGDAHYQSESAQDLECRGSSPYDTMAPGSHSNIHCQPESAQGLEGGGSSQFDTMSAGACGDAHYQSESAQDLECRGSSQYDTMPPGSHSNIHCQPESAQGLEGRGRPCYEMSCSPHGIAVIIVNDRFAQNELNLTYRAHGKGDLQAFKKIFTTLDYDILLCENYEANEIEKTMTDIASSEHHTAYDSFVCCVSTHGAEGVIYGSDGRPVDFSDLIAQVKRSETLRGKPKMFFVQSCRVLLSSATAVTADSPSDPPDGADIFIAMATTAGESAYGGGNGSWFVNSLRNVFTAMFLTTDLSHMMQSVNDIVCDREGVLRNGDGTREQVRQCCESTSTLRKSVKF